ncbi:MAG TPA: winged helix DNA-binding domain-containing protein [Gaiellaceae bacterium]|nr:winged helix DNA-binding domain-containing protein [Gaiellaceae bacterium]
MAERVLSERELNRALLERQLLLERRRVTLSRAVESMGCVQAQYAPSTYVGLWSRVEGLERDAVTRALERRTLVQATLMRNTIHVVSRRDYWPLVIAIREERRVWSRSVQKTDERRVRRAATRLERFLAGGPRRQREIEDAGLWLPGIGLWTWLVRVPPSGTWERRRADLFGLAEEWVGPEPGLAELEARIHLVRRYLGAFGPAPRADIASWAGMRAGALAEALDAQALRRFRDEHSRELLDLPRAPLPAADTAAPVRFLPTWDATLLVHARRTGILDEQHRKRIFHVQNPQSDRTFLVDGKVAGSWRHDGGGIALEPFGQLPRSARAELEAEGERLAAFHA